MKIELLFDPGCPNVDAARRTLRAALTEMGLPSAWIERVQTGLKDRFASPSILIDGEDIERTTPTPVAGCRLYLNDDGHRSEGPPLETVVAALRVALDH